MEELAFTVSLLPLIYGTIIIALSIRAAILSRKWYPKPEHPPHHATSTRSNKREPFYPLLVRRHSHPAYPLV
jgi:hypothetical protein